MQFKNFRPVRHKNTVLTEHEEPVQNGLAVTPREMMEMTAKGIPITPQNLGVLYDEGYSNLDFDVPAQHRRGVDMNDLWEMRESTKKKMRSPEFKALVQKGD